jgi:hypothetical protein
MADTTSSYGDVPETLKKYSTDLLDKAQQLSGTDYAGWDAYKAKTGRNPVADINPLMKKAADEAGKMTPAAELGTASTMAENAGLASLNAGADYAKTATDPTAMQKWMSPFITNVLDRQKSNAMMDAARQMPTLGAGAAKAGGLGGTRSALLEAESNRNLGNRMMDIDANGMQSAWESANKNLQYGADLGLRGAGQGITASNALTNVGNAKFGQALDANKNMNSQGKDIYDIESKTADKQFADFQAMMTDPMKKTEFFSGILGKIPVANKTSTDGGSDSSNILNTALAGIFDFLSGKKP